MRSTILCVIVVCFSFFLLFSCFSRQNKGEQLAKQHCGSCHLFPDPTLLDKKSWEKSVLPQMAFRMGIDYSMLSTISFDDYAAVTRVLPGQAIVDAEEWEAIRSYYLVNSPDTLKASTPTVANRIKLFQAEPYQLPISPLITFIKSDSLSRKVFVGSRLKKLYKLTEKLVVEDSFQLSSPPSHLLRSGDGELTLLLMGIMDPNDQSNGEVARLHVTDHTLSKMIDSLKRPVHFEMTDLNSDGLEDIVVCAFGNYSGALLAYKNLGGGTFEKKTLQSLPGARRVIIRDFDNNGLVDILALMSQGDEKLILLLNHGNFNFRINTLLRFPPVYGSSYFDVADFNNDGKFDILYANGDNADYSKILKPYHGIRIFLNDGKNDFKETWFYNMHGASQAVARDFDLDGDLDIAAISFFPDFRNHADQGFIYFENTNGKFLPQTTPLAAAGRWLTMEPSDIDHDGDCDLMLGALNFNSGVPDSLMIEWTAGKTSILMLRNKAR
jgi:hypothetical protein